MMMRPLFALTAIMLMGVSFAPAANCETAIDSRMQVEIQANPEEKGQSVNELHANIRYAADLALTQLWDRMIPQHARAEIPANARAIQFMLRAQPTAEGVSVSFNSRRVLDYLEAAKIPLIPEQPVWNLDVRMRNAAGQNMSQSASMLQKFAEQQAPNWGFGLNASGASMIVQWRWLDAKQASLSVRGNSRLAEFQETRTLSPGDPLPQLQQWLLDTLLKARDAYANEPQVAMPAPVLVPAPVIDIYGNPIISTDIYADPYAAASVPIATIVDDSILIMIERQASLPEQVLFEDDLRRDPRVASLLPRQLNHTMQQYRLQLKDPADTQWLHQWFAQHGLSLTPAADGWLAR